MSYSILVIDDDQTIRDVISKTLNDEGWKVIFADSGESALELFRTIIPDLILVDVGLPGLNGYETISRLKKLPRMKQMPIIFLSGQSKEEDQGRSFACGGHLYLKKPFSVNELRSIVRLSLDSVRSPA